MFSSVRGNRAYTRGIKMLANRGSSRNPPPPLPWLYLRTVFGKFHNLLQQYNNIRSGRAISRRPIAVA